MNEIIIKQNGFVTGDALLNPIAYAGEMNSRVLNVVHPTFENCYYQLLIVKNNYPYVVGIVDGEVMLPPSLINVATRLECQFLAIRKNDDLDITANNCDCYPDSMNDCSHAIYKSDVFYLNVAQGLSLNGLSPMPPYEQLVDIYNNISKAKLAAEKTKAENMQLLESINQKIDELECISCEHNTENTTPNNPSDSPTNTPSDNPNDEPDTLPDDNTQNNGCHNNCHCNHQNNNQTDEQFPTVIF